MLHVGCRLKIHKLFSDMSRAGIVKQCNNSWVSLKNDILYHHDNRTDRIWLTTSYNMKLAKNKALVDIMEWESYGTETPAECYNMLHKCTTYTQIEECIDIMISKLEVRAIHG